LKQKIFITGASGCVGHYLFDLLADDPGYELHLLVRDPSKLKFDHRFYPNVFVIKDDLCNIGHYADLLKEMDLVIHAAADWGGNEGNYDYTLSLFRLIDPQHCKKVIYFSTASILGADNQPLEEAEKFGTHYIRSKYRIYKKLPSLAIYPKIITLFPTWILGGDDSHPYSHATQGILDLKKWLWLLRFFTVDTRFHYIHALDIARIVKHLLKNQDAEKNLILGNGPITASQLIRQICEFFSLNVYFQIPLGLPFIRFLAAITRRQLHPWDLYCFKRQYFVYKTVNAESFGIESDLHTIKEILCDVVT
jgi:nucleoside-diphosphate-sugar epimerase